MAADKAEPRRSRASKVGTKAARAVQPKANRTPQGEYLEKLASVEHSIREGVITCW